MRPPRTALTLTAVVAAVWLVPSGAHQTPHKAPQRPATVSRGLGVQARQAGRYVDAVVARVRADREAQEAADAQAAQDAAEQAEAEIAAEQARMASRAPQRAVTASSGNVWDDLAQCESGGNWTIDTGNGYSGGLQITGGYAGTLTREEQIAWAESILARQGWGAWPACSRILGLR